MIKHATKKTFLLVVFVISFFSCNAFSSEKILQDEIVQKYYTSDLNGIRLGTYSDENFEKLYSWQYEPGWDYAFIVDEVNIYNTKKLSNGSASVEVKYHVIGILDGDNVNTYEFYEIVNFILVNEGSSWKIKGPIIPPHISITAAIKQLEEIIRVDGEADKARAKKLQYTVVRLKDMLAPVNR